MLEEKLSNFRKDIEKTINCYSMENGCNTPDFILAEYLIDCLNAFDKATNRREQWYGRPIFSATQRNITNYPNYPVTQAENTEYQLSIE